MDQSEEDEAIILSGLGQITQWIWPKNLTKCPVPNCRVIVENRREAIKHFRATHALVSILCPYCDKAMYARTPSKYKLHYDRKHPNMEVPFDFNGRANQSKKSRILTKQVCKHTFDKIILSFIFVF